jgi:hypothetical protein
MVLMGAGRKLGCVLSDDLSRTYMSCALVKESFLNAAASTNEPIPSWAVGGRSRVRVKPCPSDPSLYRSLWATVRTAGVGSWLPALMFE